LKSISLTFGLIVLGILFSGVVAGQHVVIVEKVGHSRFFAYQCGDKISLQTRKDSFNIEGTIVEIFDSSIVLKGGTVIPVDDIGLIYRTYKNRKRNGATMMIAGGTLMVITSINHLINNEPFIDPLMVSIGGGIAAIGGGWFAMGKRKYRIGKKWHIKILDANFFPGVP
jgi:hypothetical protein